MPSRSVRQVAVVIDASKPYDRKVIAGIGAYAQRRGRWSLYVEENPLQKLSVLRVHRWNGIIANFDHPRIAEMVSASHVPVVGVGGRHGWYDPRSGIPYVTPDEVAVTRLAFEHLRDRGFTQLAFCGFARTQVNGWSAERARAFKQLAEQSGCRCWLYYGRRATMHNWGRLQDELASWLVGLPKPVGLMACNDARARHVIEACRRIGVRVPEDIAVLGVDDDAVLCQLSDPSLTSIDQGAHRVGETAAAVLDRLMAGKRPGRKPLVVKPAGLMPRRSSDVFAVADPDVSAALRFIHDHACEGIHFNDVSACVAVTRVTLNRRFRALLGRSVHDEIQRIRMERARHLVADTTVPLKQIPAMIGMKQRTHFSVAFRGHFGHTPAAHRRLANS
jgi:LacI family transcriptional regulator